MHFFEEWKSGKWIPNTVAVCAGVILYLVLTNIGIIGVAANSLWHLVAPLAIGVILAYIIDPAVRFLEKKGLKRKPAIVITIIIILLFLILLMAALVPQLVNGVVQFLDSLSGYISSLQDQLSQIEGLKMNGNLSESISKVLNSISGYLTSNNVFSDSSGLGSHVMSFTIGVIFAIYFLIGKKEIVSWVQQFLKKTLKNEKYTRMAEFCSRCNLILVRYIFCSLVEALIVGIVNMIFMLIMKMPYASMISCIVGVTNLAPTFGPIVGCILGMFILLLANPGKPMVMVIFLIFTLILQTIDGYVIKPKLFGDTLGVSPLLILIVLVLGGRIFGVWGLLLAIPCAAIMQYAVQEYLFPYTENRFKENQKRERVTQKKVLEDHTSR